ncbi:MAG: DUF2286 domain-containing protein [Ignisphaera sp.]
MKILIIRSEEGVIKEHQIVEGTLDKSLKETVIKALELWNPQKSDLVVVRHKHEVNVNLPITKEQYELYSQFNLKRFGDKAVFEIPIYIISFENEWIEDQIRDSKVFVVAPYIDEVTSSKVLELAKNITSEEESEEELGEE